MGTIFSGKYEYSHKNLGLQLSQLSFLIKIGGAVGCKINTNELK